MELTLACIVSVTIIHCSLLTLNMWSARYLRLSKIISNCTSFCVVAFSVSAACATLIPHCSCKSYSVVFECQSADKKSCGCMMSIGFFGGSGTVAMWMSFTGCFVTSLATCCCCSLVTLSITIACFPGICTIATSIWLKRYVLNMMSSSSMIWRSSYSIGWWYLMPILNTFFVSISSFT